MFNGLIAENMYSTKYILELENLNFFRLLHLRKEKTTFHIVKQLSELIPLVSLLNLIFVGIDSVVFRWQLIILIILFLNMCPFLFHYFQNEMKRKIHIFKNIQLKNSKKIWFPSLVCLLQNNILRFLSFRVNWDVLS